MRQTLTLAALAGALLAGCGGQDAPAAPTRAQYVQRIDAICTRYQSQTDGAEAQLRSAATSYGTGDPSAFFGRLSAPLARLATLTDEAYREMRAVPVPTGQAGTQARAWLGAVRDNITSTKRLQGIVRQRDQGAFLRFAQEEAPAVDARSDSRAQALGLKRCANDDEQPAQPQPTQPQAPAPAPGQEGERVVRGGLGQPLRVSSEEGDVVMRAVRVRPRVQENEYSPVPRDQKVVGVDLEIRNVGRQTFDPPFSATLRMIDTRGGQGRYTTLIEGKCGQGFALRLAVTPGTREQGCVPFAIDREAQPGRLQVRLGYGDDAVLVEFDLRSRGGGAPQPEPAPSTGQGEPA